MNKAKFTSAQVSEVLQRLVNSEIEFSITPDILGKSIDWSISDYITKTEVVSGKTSASITEAVDEIAFATAKKFKDSAFAAWYNTRQGNGEPGASEPIRETVNA